jgi:1-acyl-sn-glycerol-3-phosphate acyltransferase
MWLPRVLQTLAPARGYGVERMPEQGGFVVAVNHFSGIDPPLVGSFSRRALYYLTKTELLAMPFIGEVLRWTGAFAVRRGASDRDALRVARWLLHEGHAVGVFVEGTRQHHGEPGTALPGAAMLALRERVPVVPCGVDSSKWTLRNRGRCAVVWGEPLQFDGLSRNGRGIAEATRLIEAEIRRLWRQAADAVAAGLPDRLPDGTVAVRPPTRREATRVQAARPWPAESWAAGPLGPLWRGPEEPVPVPVPAADVQTALVPIELRLPDSQR